MADSSSNTGTSRASSRKRAADGRKRPVVDPDQMMRFVDHQNIGCSRDPRDLGVRAAFEGLAELVEAEFLGQFAPPLLAQRRRGRDQHFGIGIVDQMLADYQPGFDGLSQPDLVGEEITLDRIAEHAAHCRDLMRHEVDPGR